MEINQYPRRIQRQRYSNGKGFRENEVIKMLTDTITGRRVLGSHGTTMVWISSVAMIFKREHRHEGISNDGIEVRNQTYRKVHESCFQFEK